MNVLGGIYGWLLMVIDGYGSLLTVINGYGWLLTVVNGYRSLLNDIETELACETRTKLWFT